ncbi:hypothetical protein [Nocardia sp. NPDC051570]|uniref:hypothetical protein n=1 Tax=Nocardia sp. NPDC051570 TaxID=3364324 RepID=UPI0037899761
MGADADLAQSGDVDHILDAGAPGLRYFEHYLPLLYQATSIEGPSYSDLCAHYDAQRMMNLVALGAVAGDLRRVLAAADAEWEVQSAQMRTLPSIWQGEAAAVTTDTLRGLVARSNDDRVAARNALRAIEFAIPALKSIIAGKANAVRALWDRTGGTIDGKNPGQISDIARSADRPIERLRAIFPGTPDDDIARKCAEWLSGPFQQDVRDKLDIFGRACADCHAGVEGLYKVITDALAQMSDVPYPTAGQQGAPQHDPGSGPTSPTRPEMPSTAPTSADSTAVGALDDLARMAAQSTPLFEGTGQALTQGASVLSGLIRQGVDGAVEQIQQGVDGAVGQVRQGVDGAVGQVRQGVDGAVGQVRQGVDGAVGQIQQGVDGAIEQVQQGVGGATDQIEKIAHPADGVRAELDTGDQQLRLEADPAGELRLTMLQTDGPSTTYTLRQDEHGIPILSEDSKPAEHQENSTDTPPPDGPPSPREPSEDDRNPQGDNQTPHPHSVPPIPPPSRRGDDSHERLRNAGKPPPEPPSDAGPELAEAGPL